MVNKEKSRYIAIFVKKYCLVFKALNQLEKSCVPYINFFPFLCDREVKEQARVLKGRKL